MSAKTTFRWGVVGVFFVFWLAASNISALARMPGTPEPPMPTLQPPVWEDEQLEPGVFVEAVPGAEPAALEAVTHPSLLIHESMIPALRARANQSPWLEMKDGAALDCLTLEYDLLLEPPERAWMMRDITSACSLAFIVDPDNAGEYKTKLLLTLANWEDLHRTLDSSKWGTTVPHASAFFNGVIALDTLYNHLTPAQITEVEGLLRPTAEYYWGSATIRSEQAWHAARGIWALYTGDRTRINSAKQAYRAIIFEYVTPDGIYTNSLTYAHHRMAGLRDPKSYFMDVLEFTQEDNGYYNNPRLQRMYEWILGHSQTPFHKLYTFGDTSEDYAPAENDTASYRAYRFSSTAAGYAAWLNQGFVPLGRLITFILYDEPLPAPLAPSSKIDYMAGAWFYENNLVTDSLSGALWNPIDPSRVSQTADYYKGAPAWSHPHKDVNAVHLAAFGEHVLRNSGYTGAGEGACGNDFTYIHSRAISSNTVMIDGLDHAGGGDTSTSLRVGWGIQEGFTTGKLDYASGHSGKALPNGVHQRGFVFIQPQDGLQGYFLLFDEVQAASTSAINANVVLHPNADNVATVADRREYLSQIADHYSTNGVKLTIFQGTAPSTVAVRNGALASWDYDVCGKYLYSSYALNNGKRNIVTVLFPHDASHPNASMERLAGTNFSGAAVRLSASVRDVALESDGSQSALYDGVSFQALAVYYRRTSGVVSQYFARKASAFSDGQGQGITAASPVSIWMNGQSGVILSPNTRVRFYYPNINDLELDGVLLIPVAQGTGWREYTIPAGQHQVQIVVGHPSPTHTPPTATLTPTPTNRPPEVTLPALEDAEANANFPSQNFGSAVITGVDYTPIRITYMKFDLRSLAGADILSAKLRFYVTDQSSQVQEVRSVSASSWSETTLTYQNRPTPGALLTTFTGTQGNKWFELDLTQAAASQAGQVFSFAIRMDGGDNLLFHTRENTNPPQLVIKYTNDGTPPPPTSTPVTPPPPTPTPTATKPPTPSPTGTGVPRVILPAVEDAEANSNFPSQNFGSALTTGVDYTPIRITYMKFDLRSLTGANILSAKLRFYVIDQSSQVQEVRSISASSWSESTLTYQNRPTLGTVLTTFSGTQGNKWFELDLTQAAASQAGQVFSFAVRMDGGDNLIFHSRENSNPPQLVIEYTDGGSPPPPTSTPVTPPPPTYTPTATNPPTPTPTGTGVPSPTPTLYKLFLPITGDAEANSNYPSQNFGSALTTGIDYTPIRITYIKVDLSQLAGKSIDSAKLRFYVIDQSSQVQTVYRISASWAESTLTYQNRPALGTVLTTISGTQGHKWFELDLTSEVRAQAGGLLSLAIAMSGGDNLIFNTRENATNKPVLEVSLSGSGATGHLSTSSHISITGPTPTPPRTATFTSTPTIHP